jgi:hypothetical protein
MVGRAGHGAHWNAGRAEPGRRKVAASHGVTIFEIDAEVRAVLSEIGNDAWYIMKRYDFLYTTR